MRNKSPIVVAGANGRVANHLVKMLLASGHQVKAIARDISKIDSLKQSGADLFQADFLDSVKLTQAFSGAERVFVYSPLILQSRNLNQDQYTIINSLSKAIKNSAVKNVVLLSSWGVELNEKSGGISGCRYFEQALDKIPAINTLILRPVWFMENFLYNIGLIKMAGINGLAIKSDVRFPMITTEDIAATAHEWLNKTELNGKNIIYIKSDKDYTMTDVTNILGNAIGRKKLKYIEFPKSVQRKGMVGTGQLSGNAADMLIEINQCISKGILKIDPAYKTISTQTTLEIFAENIFKPPFSQALAPSFAEKIQGFFLKVFLQMAGNKLVNKENK